MGSQISGNNLSDFSIKFEELSDKLSQTDPEKSDEDKTFNHKNNVNNFVYGDDDKTAAKFFNKLILSDQQRSKSVSNSNKMKINNFRKIFENAFNNESEQKQLDDGFKEEQHVVSDEVMVPERNKE